MLAPISMMGGTPGFQIGVSPRGRRISASGRLARVLQRFHSTSSHREDILSTFVVGAFSDLARCLSYVRNVINSGHGQECSKQSSSREILG